LEVGTQRPFQDIEEEEEEEVVLMPSQVENANPSDSQV